MRYESLDGAKAELDAFARALERQTQRFAETFVTAVSPGFAACSMENQHYDSHEAYVFALARELRQEYEFIVAQGHVLQIDLPDLGIERAGYFQDEPLPKFIEAMEMHVAALNEALAGIPPERVRFHACWGNRDSPHVNDVPAPDVLPVCYQVKAGALCLPFANPRHSHEVDAFKTQKLPDRMTLVCGVVETTHNYVEHPQVIAERLERAVRAVGDRERSWPEPIAASAPSSATPRCPRTWCGPSSRRCAMVPRSPASGSGAEEAVSASRPAGSCRNSGAPLF